MQSEDDLFFEISRLLSDYYTKDMEINQKIKEKELLGELIHKKLRKHRELKDAI